MNRRDRPDPPASEAFHDTAGAGRGAITIRHLSRAGDHASCVELQRETWGDAEDVLVPAAVLQVSQKIGGLVAGAFDDDGRMLGCVYSLAGHREGVQAHWSHMLAVTPDARGAGLGQKLKLYQRQEVMADGIDTIFWTYDPLVSRNAHLNLNRLGAEVVQFVPNMYGETGSPLHAGGQTDRFVVRWRLRSRRATSAIDSTHTMPDPVVTSAPVVGQLEDLPEPIPDADLLRLEVPVDLERLMAAGSPEPLAWRAASRRTLEACIEAGYRVRGFYRDREADRSFYWLARGPADDREA